MLSFGKSTDSINLFDAIREMLLIDVSFAQETVQVILKTLNHLGGTLIKLFLRVRLLPYILRAEKSHVIWLRNV